MSRYHTAFFSYDHLTVKAKLPAYILVCALLSAEQCKRVSINASPHIVRGQYQRFTSYSEGSVSTLHLI